MTEVRLRTVLAARGPAAACLLTDEQVGALRARTRGRRTAKIVEALRG